MKLKVLGTVSPYCSGTKNCPGYRVTTKEAKILLDCGSGITRNLKFPEDLENLNIIISHLHRDHYSDIFSIAYASFVFHNLGLLSKRIKVYIPYKDDTTLLDYNLLTNLGEEHYLEFIPYNETTIISIGDTKITFNKNIHNVPSYATKIEEGEKNLVYSGDTGYIGNSLETFAKGTKLLICESTFLKGQQRNQDYHLYAHEAAWIAREADVQCLMLTHFWPDIAKEDYLNEASSVFEKTKVAEEQKTYKIY